MNSAIEQKEGIINNILMWMCEESLNKTKVKSNILSCYSGISEEQASELITEALERVGIKHNLLDLFEIVRTHTEIYETIYQYYKDIGYASGINKVLRAKEDLLQLHNDGNKLILRKKDISINKRAEPIEYDLGKLTPAERDELEYLIQLASAE